MITREDLREELSRYPTRDDLREELSRYPTRDDLREELAKVATKDELAALRGALHTFREETASGFADLRRYMEILYEDLRGTQRTILEAIVGRMDARDEVVDGRHQDHERRMIGLEHRVSHVEDKIH